MKQFLHDEMSKTLLNYLIKHIGQASRRLLRTSHQDIAPTPRLQTTAQSGSWSDLPSQKQSGRCLISHLKGQRLLQDTINWNLGQANIFKGQMMKPKYRYKVYLTLNVFQNLLLWNIYPLEFCPNLVPPQCCQLIHGNSVGRRSNVEDLI